MNTPDSMDVETAAPRHGNPKHDESPREDVLQRAPRDLAVRLEVGYALHRIRGEDQPDGTPTWDVVKLRSYNGRLGGPVIETRPGDTLNLTLVNALPAAPAPQPAEYNITNVHYHGLHVSPAGNADNVLLMIKPGQHFHYEVKIPQNHPAGTYWYHAHVHGSAAIQIGSGMAGALIIRGDIDRVPAIRASRERIILFQQIPYKMMDDPTAPGQRANMVEDITQFNPGEWADMKRRFTLNGLVEPVYEMAPGEVQRWRFIHAGLREGLRLRFVQRQAGQETPWTQYQLAHDGITTGRLDTVTETEMHPGYRADVLVRATGDDGRPLPPGTYYLVDQPDDGPSRTLARIVVRGAPVRMRLPDVRELAPLAPFAPITREEVQGHQDAVFSISGNPPRFLINGQPFDHSRVRRLPLGAVEEWNVSSLNASHPFHIHVNPFQFTTPEGKILWKDTLLIVPGTVYKLRTRYDRYIGVFMMHCHIAQHADLGMAEHVEVAAEGGEHAHPPTAH